jgi:hypothetical protein
MLFHHQRDATCRRGARCIRAARALVVAVRERDMARLRACIEVFEEANKAYEGFSS